MKIKFRANKFFYTLVMALFFIVFPFFSGSYNLHLVILCFIWSTVAICWNLLLGYSGISAFGNLVFFAVGGYSSAWLAINLSVSPWIGIFIGGCFALLLSIIMGFLTFKLRGIYTALFTFAFQEMLRYIVLLPEVTRWSGGPIGLLGVPGFTLANFDSAYLNYYVGFGVMLITNLAIYKTLNSRIGLAIKAMAQSEIYAKTLGINVLKTRLFTFIVAAFFTGIAGSFSAHYLGVVSDEYLSFSQMVSIIFMILIGGLGTFYGPIVGAFIFTFISEYLKGILAGAIRLIAIGVLVVIILIFIPSGILETVRKLFHLIIRPKLSERLHPRSNESV